MSFQEDLPNAYPNKRYLRPFLTAILAALVTGCTLPVTITDYTFSTVSRQDLSKFGDGKMVAHHAPVSDEYIHVKLTTKENLVGLAREKSLIIDPKVRFCDSSSRKNRLNMPWLIRNGKSIFEWTYYNQGKPLPIPAAEKEYDLIIYASLEENRFAKQFNSNSDHAGHDLYTNPRDICISIEGGTYGTRLVSNEVRISKDDIFQMFNPQ